MFAAEATSGGGALEGHRHRVVVTSDIGGTDPDDYQSMAHLLLYADAMELEGLVSSPWGAGRAEHVHEVRLRRHHGLIVRELADV